MMPLKKIDHCDKLKQQRG